jgi:hypothetical protein
MSIERRGVPLVTALTGTLTATLTAVALLLSGCSSGPRIRTDVDPAADFGAYRTFGFHEPFGLDRDGYGTPVGTLVRAAVKDELQRRGLRPAERDPDLLINAGGMVADKQRVDTVPGGYYGYRYGRYGGWPAYDEVIVTNYREGTLTIDVIDRERRQMVWSSTAVDAVTDSKRAQRDVLLPQVVGKMFAQFPIAAPAQG